MHLLRVFQNDEMRVVVKTDTELFTGLAAVQEQALLEGWIGPGPRNDGRTKRGRTGVEHFDLARDLAGSQKLFLDQQLTHGGLHDLVVTRWFAA
jgi:hypothetical protein